MTSDAIRPLWQKTESVEVTAEPAFAFKYLASIENMSADPGIDRVKTDGQYRDRPGMRGRTYLKDGGHADWIVTDVEPDRLIVIDLELPGACLRFELRFDSRIAGGTTFTQRVSLFGLNATEFLHDVEAGFATSLRDGMRAIGQRIDAAACRQ